MNARDLGNVYDMVVEVRNLAEFTEGVDREAFEDDRLVQYAVIRALTIIGEAAARVSEVATERHPEIPWSLIVGMRNILVHDYDGIDLDEVWSAATEDVPALEPRLEQIVDEAGEADETTGEDGA